MYNLWQKIRLVINYEILDALRREKVTKYWICYSTIQIMFNYFVTLTSKEESEIDKKITKKSQEIKKKNEVRVLTKGNNTYNYTNE